MAQYCVVDHYYGCGYSGNLYYAAIEEVGFYANGKELWRKSPDGCVDYQNNYNTGSHYHQITTTPTFSLSYGADFQIKMNGSERYTYNANVGIWIDLNRDGDFNDADEFLGNNVVTCRQTTDPTGGGTHAALTTLNFSLPCGAKGSGPSVIRIRSSIGLSGTYAWQRANACNRGAGYPQYYGETEDFAVQLESPTSLAAGFFVPDTAFVGTRVLFKNDNQTGYVRHDWDINADGSYEYSSTDADHKFNTVGTKCVQLRSENCLGVDSITKCFAVVDPPGPPTPDFVADKNVIELYNSFRLTDLSNNGPTYWDWYMYQEDDSANTHIDGDSYLDLRGGDDLVNKNPEVFTAKGIPGFPSVGLWTVCLTSSNQKWGALPKPVCKKDYIEVTKGCDAEMGPGTLTSIPGNTITCAAGTLKNKDNGSGNYATPEANLDALIAPCGASKVSLTFDYFTVKSNVNLKIYDGQDASGVALHSGNGFNDKNPPTGTLVANSGAMYFLWNSSGTQTDKGFLARWTSELSTPYPPVAGFSVADTSYNSKWVKFENTSKNLTGEVFYTWEVSDPVQGTTSIEGVGKNFERLFTSNQKYNVCLTVETCAGKDKSCKTITIVAPDSKSEIDFEADNRRPRAGETVMFNAWSDKANMYEWTFFPGNSVTVSSKQPDNSELEVEFTAPGKYTVACRGYNTVDSAASVAQVIKDQYIVVISYCTPVIGVTTSADIATNKVMLTNDASPMDTMLMHVTDVPASGYSNFAEDDEIAVPTLTFGGTYHLTTSRNTTVNKMSRKVWIDWNIDGDFDDAGELVGNESAANTAMKTFDFTVPDLKNAFEGVTRMRIGTSYSNDANEPCGANSGVNNANRIGEFEDYALRLSNDFTMPIIVLNGDDTAYVELNTSYTDAGAVAMDPTEGNISSRLEVTSDVDINYAGIYYVTYNVSDASGNRAVPVTRVVYVVVDQTAPTLTLLGKNPEIIEFDPNNSSYMDPGATATDNNDGDLTTAIQVSGSVDVFKIGTYQLVYTVQDAQGNMASQTRTVVVQDTKAPVITNDEIKVIGGVNVVEVQLQSVFVDRTVGTDEYNNGTFGPRAVLEVTPGDNGDANVDTREKGTTTAVYTMEDESGNKTTLTIDYVVEDYIAPVIDLKTLDTVWHKVNTQYIPVEPSVSDNLYDNTQVSLTRKSNVNPFVLGMYEDTYTATDASGNVAVKKRWVRVYDAEKPVIEGREGNIVRLGLFSQVRLFNYVKMTDNYDAPQDLFDNSWVISNDVNVYQEGIYACVFQTKDNSGNMSEPFTLFVVVSRDYFSIVDGIEEITEDDLLKVYPNPSKGLFNIAIELPSTEDVSIEIYDVLGNKIQDVAEGAMQNGIYTVDMSANANGVYFVRMQVSGAVINKKVVLNR
ncbi:MAG: DUF5011 domain-containing protein [Flavobacteriales bacterium]|nr:DUF5011 domain-containing protein [Flavobacteriales bacterium]